MLCWGTVLVKEEPAKLMSLRRVITLLELNCQTCPLPLSNRLVTLMMATAAAVSCLLITKMVSTPSDERNEAKVETPSGFGPVALTLVSPKPEPLPS